jgi:glycosyltransferase involved in cell wall biosynthesis
MKWVMPPLAVVIPNLMKIPKQSTPSIVPFNGIGFIGGLEYRKGLDVVIDSLAHVRIPTELIPFPVHVYGPVDRPWEMINGIQSLLYINRSCEASPHISCIFHGTIASEIMWADMVEHQLLFIMASRQENQPMAILEAAEKMRPAIILRQGYSDEMLTTQGAVDCIIPHSVLSLAQRLQEVYVQVFAFVANICVVCP